MAVLVKKFGGSSVATPEKIYRLVDRVPVSYTHLDVYKRQAQDGA